MQILLDMDGVIADFFGGVKKWAGLDANTPYPTDKKYDIFEAFGISPQKFWNGIDVKFWLDLEPFPHMEDFVGRLMLEVGEDNVCILTSASNHESAYGKTLWIKRHLPLIHKKRNYLIGAAKHFCTGPKRILIDDWEVNTEKYMKHGGTAILFPRPWNSLHVMSDQAVESTLAHVRRLKDE